jgi:hypothetical protein
MLILRRLILPALIRHMMVTPVVAAGTVLSGLVIPLIVRILGKSATECEYGKYND